MTPVMQGQAIKIARHLRFGAATPPLVFPGQLTGLTGRWRISDLHYGAGAGVLQADSYTLTTGTSRFFPRSATRASGPTLHTSNIHPSPRTGTCTPHDPATQNTSAYRCFSGDIRPINTRPAFTAWSGCG